MDKRAIIFLCILIALPFGGVYMLIKGILDNNIAQISGGAISCVIAVILWVIVIYFFKKQSKKDQKPKRSLTPEEQKQRNLAFIKRHSKAFLAWSVVSVILAVASLILLIIFAKYNDLVLIALSVSLVTFTMIFVALFASYMGVKWENKKKKVPDKAVGKTIDIGEEVYDDNVLEQSETATTETMTEAEKQNAEEWLKYKAEQEQKQREWFWEQQRKAREEQERCEREKREKEQKSMKYFNELKFALVTKYQETVFNFIEKLTDNYPHLFLKMFKDTEIPMSSILVKPYFNISNLLETKILFDGLKFTETADSNMNKKIQELTDFFIKGLKKRITENGDYNDEFTFSILLYNIIRNNVVKYYRNVYIETYGYESLDELCDYIANPFEQDKTKIKVLDDVLTISRFMSNNAISQFVYYYIYENNIELPFVDTYKKIVLDMKQIFERQKKEKLENDLFGKPKKKTVTEGDTPYTLSPIERIDRMTGEQFEIFMEDYFRKQGFKVERTPLSGDYGIDLIIENDFSKIGVQAKCYSNKVTASAVQEVVTGLRHYGLSGGMVVTNNYFQPAAIQLAKDNGITLWNRDKLIEKLN